MANGAHLFKPGQSGNPKGRAKGSFTVSTFVKNKLYKPHQEDIIAVVNLSFKKALAGETWAIKLIYEYFVTKQVDLDDENVHALFEDKLKEMSKEQLEGMSREVFEVVKKQLEEKRLDG